MGRRRNRTAVVVAAAMLATTQLGRPASQMKISFGGYTNRTEDLSDFPALVVFSNGMGGTDFDFERYPFLSANGHDLRFCDAGESVPLNYEIEQWNTNGPSYVWVQVPLLAADGSTSVRAKWGDPSQSDPLPCTTNGATWAPAYAAVWHLAETNAGGPYPDSTANAEFWVGQRQSPVHQRGGRRGEVLSRHRRPVHVHALRPAAWRDHRRRAAHSEPVGQAVGRCRSVRSHRGEGPALVLWGHNADVETADALPPGQWSCLAITYDGSEAEFVLNGVTVHAATRSLYTLSASAFLGYAGWQWDAYGANDIPFCADEFRVADVRHTTNWLWASYMTMASNQVFGTLELIGSPAIETLEVTGVTSAAAWLNGNLAATGGLPTEAWV